MRKIIVAFNLVAVFGAAAQVSYPNQANGGSGQAERVTSFTVAGAGNDRLEVVNATNFDGQFVPTLWSYRNTDNRHVLGITANIPSTMDNGTTPLMIFSTAIANNLQLNAPSSGTFPWGEAGTAVNVNIRPLFQWRNNSLRIMTMAANGFVGVGTENPSTNLHVNGSVRFENLQTRLLPNFLLSVDTAGNLFKYAAVSTGNGNCASANFVIKGTGSSTTCGSIFDNGRIGIGTTQPSALLHTVGDVRFEKLPEVEFVNFLITDSTGFVSVINKKDAGFGLVNNCYSENIITKQSAGGLTCSQIIDDGINVGVGYSNPNFALDVNGTLHCTNLTTISDIKFKKNIAPISNSLETILKLNGKTYNWKKEEFKDIKFSNELQYGLIAQEVKEVLPTLVSVSGNGEYSVNYLSLIPILIESVKELANQNAVLNNKINELVRKDLIAENKITDGKTYFSSNYPNPFETETLIDFFIDKSVNTARIILFDVNGSTIRKYDLNERGLISTLKINKEDLKSGIYFYTLMTDNFVIGTKKMIVK